MAPTQAFRANETYLTATSKGPFGRNRAGRMALVGFVVLVLALTGAVIVGKQNSGRRPSPSALHSSDTTGAGRSSSSSSPPPQQTIPAPGPSPTVAAVVPNPTASSTGAVPSQALTTASVTGVFKQIWPLFSTYASEDDLAGLLSVSTEDVAHVIESTDVCGCDGLWSSYSSLEFSAPAQASYPLSFFAEVDQPDIPDGPVVQFLVFERQTDREPWMITYATGYGGTRHLLGTTSQLGSAPMAINPGSTPFVALAALFQSLRETGSALRGNLWSSSIKDPGYELTEFATDLTEGYELDHGSGIDVSATYGVDDFSPDFAMPAGSLACATITAEVFMHRADGSPMTQTNTGAIFGPLVPPGNFSTITFHEAVDTCVEVVGRTYELEGLVGGTYSVTWT
jgi:hypothetical protein